MGSSPDEETAERPSFRQGFGFASLSFVLGALLAVGSSIAIARLYGIETIGLYALASAPVGFVWFLSTVKEKPALVRRLAVLPPRHPQVTGLFFATFVFSFGLTAVVSAIGVGLIFYVFNGPIDHPELIEPALVSLTGYLLLGNTCWYYDSIFSSFRSGRQLFWIRLNQSGSFVVFAAILALLGADVWGLVFAQIGADAVSLVHRFIASRRWMRFVVPFAEIREAFSELPEIIFFGLKLAPGAIALGITGQAATWILGVTSSVATVGAWNRVWSIGKRILELNGRLTEMVFPTLVERFDAGDLTGFERALVDSMRYAWVGLLLPAAVAGGAATGVMELFGPGFEQGAGALAFILIVPAMTVGVVIQGLAFVALDMPLVNSYLNILRMVATLASTVPLTLALGLTGAAIGLVVGCVVQFAVQSVMVQRYLVSPIQQVVPYRHLVGIGVAYAAGFVVARAIDTTVPGLGGLALALVAGSAAYVACVPLVGGLLPRDRELVNSLTRRFRTRRVTRAEALGS